MKDHVQNAAKFNRSSPRPSMHCHNCTPEHSVSEFKGHQARLDASIAANAPQQGLAI